MSGPRGGEQSRGDANHRSRVCLKWNAAPSAHKYTLLQPNAMWRHVPSPSRSRQLPHGSAFVWTQDILVKTENSMFLVEFECVRNTAPHCVCKRLRSTELRQMVAGKDAILSSKAKRCQKSVSKQKAADSAPLLPACKTCSGVEALVLSIQGQCAEHWHLVGEPRTGRSFAALGESESGSPGSPGWRGTERTQERARGPISLPRVASFSVKLKAV